MTLRQRISLQPRLSLTLLIYKGGQHATLCLRARSLLKIQIVSFTRLHGLRQILACLIVLDHGCGVNWTCHPWTEVGTSVKHLGVVIGAGIWHLGARAYHILR